MTDIVERLEHVAHCDAMLGKGSSAKIIREGIAEIASLRRQLQLQREKLPTPIICQRDGGPGIGNRRDLPEAP